jgi:hypothetical protein
MPGLLLSRYLYQDTMVPLLERYFPAMRYSAALIGPGSEVLGYDTPISIDHDWGPRLQLFLSEEDLAQRGENIDDLFREQLPDDVRGYSTLFGLPDVEGARQREAAAGPVDHRVEVHSVDRYFSKRLGFDSSPSPSAADWLIAPEQTLLELTVGQVYHDGLGTLEPLRASLAYYPRDIWLFRMAAQWRRIAQQEAFHARAGGLGDELGAALIAAGQVREMMRLSFLIDRRYAPYSKWLGTAFTRLPCAAFTGPLFEQVLAAHTWRERDEQLSQAYVAMALLHNALAITAPIDAAVSSFHGRPFQGLHSDRFAVALREAIGDPQIRALPEWGAVDQLSDSVDVLTYPAARLRLRSLYS